MFSVHHWCSAVDRALLHTFLIYPSLLVSASFIAYGKLVQLMKYLILVNMQIYELIHPAWAL